MTVDYAACRDALERAHSKLDASESHGILCGLLCAAVEFPEKRWLGEVLESSDSNAGESLSCVKTLQSARREAARQLEEQQFEFTPLLPDDDAPLARRGRALARWCRGFLYGLALGGLDEAVPLSEQVREVLADLSEFTRLDVPESAPENNASESDYTELVEYVRVGVMLVHVELRARLQDSPADEKLH